MEHYKLRYKGVTEIKGTIVGEIGDIVEILLEDGCTMLLPKNVVQVEPAQKEVPAKRISKKDKESKG